MRGGYLREIYHTEDESRLALKDAVAIYHDRVREAVRQINKLRGRCRCYGVTVPGRVLKNPSFRKEWASQLNLPDLNRQLSILWVGFDAVSKQVKMARKEITRLSQSYPIISYWKDLPGIGPIRAITPLCVSGYSLAIW